VRLLTLSQLLGPARRDSYAVPHFNVCNLETVQTVLAVAEEVGSPVILGIHPLEVAYAGASTMVEVVRSVGEGRRLDVAIHLDHGTTREAVMNCVRGGFTSVMYDGSASSLDENLAVTKWVVEAAHAAGLSVEGEIGAIGQTGEFGEEVAHSPLADLGSAVALAGTGIDCLALAYGSAHGFYTAEPSLDFDLLAAVADRVDIPIVLHGGTGIPEDQVRKSIDLGVAKINFSAVLRRAFISAMREHLEREPDELSIMAVLSAGSQRMKEPLRDCIALCRSAGRVS
jgi:ketose-bisphosphate aldolase